MHILHTESSCGWGGQEVRILTESEGMMAKGHQVTIACPDYSNIYREANKRGIKTVALPIEKKKLSSLKVMHRFLSANEFDVINTHSSTDSWLVSLCLIWKKHRPGIVRSRHLSTPVHPNRASLWLYQKGNDFVVTTGERLRQTLHRDNGVALEKMKSVPTGIDDSKFKPAIDKSTVRKDLGIPADKIIIGILATLRDWKGHEYLFEALTRLQSDYHLMVIGDGPYRPSLEKKIDELGIRDNVSLVGNQENVVPWLQALDIFTLPSYGNEGVPQSIMQAMLCGLPIISTDVGSILEVLIPEKNGICVNTQDAVSLAEALNELITEDDKRQSYGEFSRKFALENCTLNQMVQDMEAIFQNSVRKA
ncbi:hypothetical protein ACH42_06750 [Endozoicomonas sp. (ex Bugula neritina AB1)]|nr:hypothetical protein ACH42_06750 [Endozoicomonas sp. (ex Bugula neritina AB1)]